MSQIKIRHFKRASIRSDRKELVTELVEDGSDTARFLKKMEDKRLSRPCFLSLDMRGRVQGECRKYVINDRVHFLDDISYGIFQKGLRENRGVFTVGTYEAIVDGEHTNRRIREAQEEEQARRDREQGVSRPTAPTARPAPPPGEAGAEEEEEIAARQAREGRFYNPDLIPFGYFKKRAEDRLQYVTSVELLVNGVHYSGSTRDLSVKGLQVGLKGVHRLQAGDVVEVSFSGLAEEAGRLDVSAVRYRVVGGHQKPNAYIVRLRLDEAAAPPGFGDFIGEVIQRYRRRYKLDVEDDHASVSAWLYERLYAENLVQIPLFLGQDTNGDFYVQAVAVTDGNQPLSQFFRNDVENFDFRPLCLPQRVKYLFERHEMQLVLYREQEGGQLRLHSMADGDEFSAADRKRFLRFALAHDEHCIVKVTAGRIPVKRPSERKIDLLTGRLLEKAEQRAQDLVRDLGDLVCVCMITDITEQVRDAVLAGGAEEAEVSLKDLGELSGWVGETRIRLRDHQEQERARIQEVPPHVVRFGYVERRREDRFLAQTDVSVSIGKKQYAGRTRDISIFGACVKMQDNPELSVGDDVRIGYKKLQEKRQKIDLRNVPYRVVNVQRGPITTVMLERVRESGHYELNEFFAELINKNRDKLVMDTEDVWSAAASRVYESICADNVSTIPFFLARGEEGGVVLQRVAVPEASSPLADFFKRDDGSYDFSWLTDPKLIVAIYGQIAELSRSAGDAERPSPCEVEMYFYKAPDPDTGLPVLYFAHEPGFESDGDREAFLEEALSHDEHRFVKIMATYTLEMNKAEVDSAVEQLREQSRHRAFRLQEQIAAVVGYGELIDITAQVTEAREQQ